MKFLKKASTAPFGTNEHGFDIVALAAGAGASFVARETVAKPILLDRLIERAIVKKGFSLVEVMTPCPTTYGRRNKEGDGVAMTEYLKVHSVPKARADKLPEDDKEEAVVTGVFVDDDKPEYTAEYARMVEKLRESKVAG